MFNQVPDIGPNTGKPPDTTAKPGDQKLDKIGTGQRYLGQKYDSTVMTSSAEYKTSARPQRMVRSMAAVRPQVVVATRTKIMIWGPWVMPRRKARNSRKNARPL